MTLTRAAKVSVSIVLAACFIGIVFLSVLVQSSFQTMEERNLEDFLSGKTNVYKGFDYAGLPY